MSPAWPTEKVVRLPAEAPSVFEVRFEADANWVSCDRSSENTTGLVEPLPGAVSAMERLAGVFAPAVVSYLPAVVNLSGEPPVAVMVPSGLVAAQVHWSGVADLVKV